ncbi:MAG: acyl-CoA dehydrogenase family protein [Planctomycetota bacterium]
MTASPASSEEKSRQVAEDARQEDWSGHAFLRELFLGRLVLENVHPFPVPGEDRLEFKSFYDRMAAFLKTVDSVAIDETGEYPDEVVDGLRELGAFGMKIPKEYGGLGFSQTEYNRVMELLGSQDGNLCALLSAHQSIGVPQPIKLFGTDEQKKRILPRCAKGAISAFALTEPHVGSDPASLSTTVKKVEGGYQLSGEKLWCTNGTLAELLVVMARDPETDRISAFVVETDADGVEVEHRCRFMGLRALANAVITFKDVFVPQENLIGAEGKGLKIALVTLNTGRLTLPAACAGIGKQCLEIVRGWANARSQWGAPVGKHEAIAHDIADMAATTYAMDSINLLASQMADRGGYDIRLEAAAAKEWNTTRCWHLVDKALQIRGGRGYETERSLEERGEQPIPIERTLRDCRINLIFEGSSEIMHLFMAREAVDKHLQVAGSLIDPKVGIGAKLGALPKVMGFYATWYPSLWLRGFKTPFQFRDWGSLGGHLRFIERCSRKLARSTFHGMMLHGAKLERKQAFLFRIVDVALELFAMVSCVARAKQLADSHDSGADRAAELTDLFCRSTKRRIAELFRGLWRNEDNLKNRVAKHVLSGEHAWLEEGATLLGLSPEQWAAQPFSRPEGTKKPENANGRADTARPEGSRGVTY